MRRFFTGVLLETLELADADASDTPRVARLAFFMPCRHAGIAKRASDNSRRQRHQTSNKKEVESRKKDDKLIIEIEAYR
jgi:hypothetical protein